ncbi:hypothetical protein ABUJ42_19040 [Salmonella enterica subsp. enterica serovar Chester]|uniref:hypothetical protein n=1 Tax=Salmonella enterica TaxID=28901 RepID=UPI001273202A|nr:hypothetical protein [Salmonella enterica]EBO1314145.1 hypothetical protein [Salmonella enterica]EGG4117549.1 hypothetical protein [Salmonella enterica]
MDIPSNIQRAYKERPKFESSMKLYALCAIASFLALIVGWLCAMSGTLLFILPFIFFVIAFFEERRKYNACNDELNHFCICFYGGSYLSKLDLFLKDYYK